MPRYSRNTWIGWAMMAALGAVFATAAFAATLDRLPAALTLPQSADSPGKVTFSHTTHVDSGKPDCTGCHPGLFKILKSTPSTDGTILHAKMDKGRQCGACHNGKAAFGFDDCTACHRE
jgi:c(7)-type cytochrome triheme protein